MGQDESSGNCKGGGLVERIPLLDEVRGFAVLAMAGYHLLWDLEGLPWAAALLGHPAMGAARNLFAGLFVAMAGGCCLLSRNNWRRGGLCLLAAEAVSMAAGVIGVSIRFGVLHLLGTSMVLAAWAMPVLEKIPARWGFWGAVGVVLLTAGLPQGRFLWMALPEWEGWSGALYPLGIWGGRVPAADYFPLLPWGGVFFGGFFAGKKIMARGIPPFAMKRRSRFLAACGRNTLWIYLLHQPVLMGALLLFGYSAR